MPQVTRIPATIRPSAGISGTQGKAVRKVAAYARVSTDKDDQVSSYEAQVDYYENYIKSRQDWKFVKVYTDEGITGTSTKRREGFRTMVQDALDGKIDLIVTKSVSRFARNTVDSISTIRQLKAGNIEVYFEKENIWTFDGKGELLITIMSSLAQEESRSISENCIWGKRKAFADGKVWVPFSKFLGYDRGPDGNLVINEEQAKIVRKIYSLFIRGYLPSQIARTLTKEGVPTVSGKSDWKPNQIFRILQNEKYKGDALLQKNYVQDFLTKKIVKNSGEIPQYYVEGNHEPIIDPEVFDHVQVLLRQKDEMKIKGDSCFANTVVCGECGAPFSARTWHSNDKYRKRVWQCHNRYTGTRSCRNGAVDEKVLQSVFVRELNALIKNRDEVVKESKSRGNIQPQLDELDGQMNRINEELNRRAEELDRLLKKAGRGSVQNSEDYLELCSKYEDLQIRYNEIKKRRTDLSMERYAGRDFRRFLEKAVPVQEFDEGQWRAFVKRCEVYADGRLRLTFRDGTIIETTK